MGWIFSLIGLCFIGLPSTDQKRWVPLLMQQLTEACKSNFCINLRRKEVRLIRSDPLGASASHLQLDSPSEEYLTVYLYFLGYSITFTHAYTPII